MIFNLFFRNFFFSRFINQFVAALAGKTFIFSFKTLFIKFLALKISSAWFKVFPQTCTFAIFSKAHCLK